MQEQSLSALVENILNRLKEIIKNENIIGKPIDIQNGTTIIPISKISIGCGGGTAGIGGGANVIPKGFLVCSANQNVRYISISSSSSTIHEQIIDLLPLIMDKLSVFMDKKKDKKNT